MDSVWRDLYFVSLKRILFTWEKLYEKKFAKFLTFGVIVPTLDVGLESAGWMGKSKENSSIFFMLFYTFFSLGLFTLLVSCTLISDIHIRAPNYFHMQSRGSPLLTIASPRLNDGGEFILCSVKRKSLHVASSATCTSSGLPNSNQFHQILVSRCPTSAYNLVHYSLLEFYIW